MSEDDQAALVAGFSVAMALMACLVVRSQMPDGWREFVDEYGGPRLRTDRDTHTGAVDIINRAIIAVKEYIPP